MTITKADKQDHHLPFHISFSYLLNSCQLLTTNMACTPLSLSQQRIYIYTLYFVLHCSRYILFSITFESLIDIHTWFTGHIFSFLWLRFNFSESSLVFLLFLYLFWVKELKVWLARCIDYIQVDHFSLKFFCGPHDILIL